GRMVAGRLLPAGRQLGQDGARAGLLVKTQLLELGSLQPRKHEWPEMQVVRLDEAHELGRAVPRLRDADVAGRCRGAQQQRAAQERGQSESMCCLHGWLPVFFTI